MGTPWSEKAARSFGQIVSCYIVNMNLFLLMLQIDLFSIVVMKTHAEDSVHFRLYAESCNKSQSVNVPSVDRLSISSLYISIIE